jgi:hypothetical protein
MRFLYLALLLGVVLTYSCHGARLRPPNYPRKRAPATAPENAAPTTLVVPDFSEAPASAPQERLTAPDFGQPVALAPPPKTALAVPDFEAPAAPATEHDSAVIQFLPETTPPPAAAPPTEPHSLVIPRAEGSKLFREFSLGMPRPDAEGWEGAFKCSVSEDWWCLAQQEFAGFRWLMRLKFYGGRLGIVELNGPLADSVYGGVTTALKQQNFLLLSIRSASGAYLDWVSVSQANPFDTEGNRAKMLDWHLRNGPYSHAGWRNVYADLSGITGVSLLALAGVKSERDFLRTFGHAVRLGVLEAPVGEGPILRLTFLRLPELEELLEAAAPASVAPF